MSLAIIGIDPLKTRTESEGAEFSLNARGAVDSLDGDGVKEYVYVSSATLQVVGHLNLVDSAGAAVPSTVTLTAPGQAAGRRCAVAVSAIPADGFGWMQIYGNGAVLANDTAALNTPLNATANAGEVDDDATSGSEVINGLVLNETADADAVFACTLNYPFVGATNA